MASKKIRPRLLFAGEDGQIYDHPELLMLCRRGEDFGTPRPEELMPLPEESEIFLLPGRRAVGMHPEHGPEAMEECAVAAFISPAHTLTAHPAYMTGEDAPTLPLFAYGAVGYANGRLWVCAKKVDEDPRQIFKGIPRKRIQKGAREWMDLFPDNRLVKHLTHCGLTSCCPAARNLFLGRFEAPLPTSRSCNARCLGCISFQPDEAGFPSTQDRISFTPTAKEIVQIMERHCAREPHAIYSFGQGCEGEPLTEAELLAESITTFRRNGGAGTVNINTNGSLHDTIPMLADAGLTSIRVSLSSAREELYNKYYRPKGYSFGDVVKTIETARSKDVFVSLNYFYFPGISDTESELQALTELVNGAGVNFIQLRNLNFDPELYMDHMGHENVGPSMGFINFRKRLRKACPQINFGYFNPFITPKGPFLHREGVHVPEADEE